MNTPGINGARTMAGAVEGQPMLRALRTPLAIEHGAEVTCPVTIGYHLRTVAEAANEDLERGMTLSDIAPFLARA
ncbi:hypothetical protein NKJ06_29290 [Mesorhizobium sp. M0293]|uniref:hypothetical protein n=1 Tax=unclassified Mesorhizobium TaxID=325217 RepID=UPI00333AB7C2